MNRQSLIQLIYSGFKKLHTVFILKISISPSSPRIATWILCFSILISISDMSKNSIKISFYSNSQLSSYSSVQSSARIIIKASFTIYLVRKNLFTLPSFVFCFRSRFPRRSQMLRRQVWIRAPSRTRSGSHRRSLSGRSQWEEARRVLLLHRRCSRSQLPVRACPATWSAGRRSVIEFEAGSEC